MKKNQVKCKICGKEHALGGCPEFQSPSSGSSSKSKDAEEPALRKGHEVSRGAERKEQHPTPKPKIGRPRTGFNKKEYNRQFTADLRTIKRQGLNMTVAEFRKSKEK